MKSSNILLIALLMFFLTSCSKATFENSLKISVTTWIGYMPLFYAKEKGWLNDVNIKLVSAVSLSENMYLYQSNNSDAFCGTQYEYSVLKQQQPDLIPIMLFDRSNGGDMIMSSHSIEQLQNSLLPIHAYLEMDSVNFTLLNDFINKYHIDEARLNFINRDQVEISSLTYSDPDVLMLMVTYIPFNIPLEKNGFSEILSTSEGLDLLVIDGLYTQRDVFVKHEKQFVALKKFNDQAVDALINNPLEFYQTVKPYIENQTFQEFSSGLDDIVWLNSTVSKKLKNRMRQASFPLKDIL